ncbi:MAG: flavodoxin domain-containing protein [Clostridia bacterium]|nr:flavodoxin domain-containing protein [Clostridia bacterium]
MKILIAYDSGKGTVKTAVERMMRPLKNLDVTVISLNELSPDPNEYDLIVLGGSVRFGKLRPAVRKYLKANENVLAQKDLALFFCCGLVEEQEYYAEKLFPASLRDAAFHLAFFGGSLNTDDLPFFDKIMVKSMRSSLLEAEMDNGNYVPNLPYILPENIDDMANAIVAKANERLKAEKASDEH